MHSEHDYLATTGHCANPERDYANFRSTGATVVRSGLRTRYVNPARGVYDFDDAVRQARAAEEHGIFVYWDLCHYDHPRWVADPWSDELVAAFAELGEAFADRLSAEGITEYGICVWNEILLWASWMGNDSTGAMALGEGERGAREAAWRRLGIRSTFETMRRVHAKHPHVRFLVAEPSHREQISAFLGELRETDPVGTDKLVIGLNVYPITHEPHSRRPQSYFTDVVRSVRERLPGNEIIFSETSSVGNWGLPDRMSWFNDIYETARLSDVETIIWYPSLNHGAWHDESVLVEHGGWDQDEERTEFYPLTDSVRRANGVPVPDRQTASA